MTGQGSSLFFVSTPLHLMVSLAIVDREKINNAHLFFIDQDDRVNNIYRQTLLDWSDNPFSSINVFYRPPKNMGKLKARKICFSDIKCLVEKLQSTQLFTGNDRRIEFQYAMHIASNLSSEGLMPKPQGFYMDEGTFTYVGRPASNSWSDKIFDNALKKIFYGRWWRHPPTVGASSWIDAIYASVPEQVCDLLKNKPCRHLDMSYWQADKLVTFSQRLLREHIDQDMLATIDVLITLPHESILQSNDFDCDVIIAVLNGYLAVDNIRLAVKYHPRDVQRDSLNLESERIQILPAGIPFEAMLPVLKANITVLGDFSTTLITSKLLRPQSTVKVFPQKSDKLKHFSAIYQALGIDTCDGY